MDGSIWIEKSCLPSPRLSTKRKKLRSGRKTEIKKKIPIEVPVHTYIQEGKIQVTNCIGAWTWINGVDTLAFRLLCKYFREYQTEGLPSKKIFLFSWTLALEL